MWIKSSPLALLVAAALTAGAVQAAPVALDRTAAVVNNDIILESELDATERQIARQLQRSGGGSAIAARKAALEQLISRSLVLQLASRNGINPTDLQIDQALAQAAERSHMSQSQILAEVAPGRSGAEAREAFRNALVMNEVRRSQIRSRIHVSEHEVTQLAKKLRQAGSVEPSYHLAQIVVPLSPSATPAQMSAANNAVASIRQALRNGENFNDLAARYTRGELASQGGDLGYMPESRVPLPFIPALIKAAPGDVIGPTRSPLGLHLIKVIDISHSAVAPVKLYDASHILIRPSIVFSDEAAREKLANLRRQIVSGKISFAEAAHQNSEDPGSAVQGGSLGYSSPDRYDPAFAREMVNLRPGQISEPFRSSFGWHIIKLNNVKVDQNSEEAFRDRARNILYERAFNEQAQAWEQELRDSAYINVRDPALLKAGVDLNQGKR